MKWREGGRGRREGERGRGRGRREGERGRGRGRREGGRKEYLQSRYSQGWHHTASRVSPSSNDLA